ncbi:MAG: DMT family transporter [Woeseiaceae bacterium]
MSAKSSPALAIAAALITLLFWGGTAIANRYAVGFADPITVATLRSLLAGLLALIIAVALKLKVPSGTGDRSLLLASGLSSFALWPIFLSLGLERTTASHAALIMATLPIITVILASIVNRTTPAPAWWIGAVAALVGAIWLILGQGASLGVADSRSAAIGDLIILVGCVICASGYVAGAKLTPKIGTFATTFWGLAAALFLTVPIFAFYQQDTDWAAVPIAAWWSIAWLTICSSLLGYLLWFYALGHGGIEKVGSLQLLMPVITLVGAVLILDEVLTPQLVALSVLVLFGTVVAHRYSTRDQ